MNNHEEINVQSSANEQAEKKSYTKPELKKFGGLSELVQNQPGIGTDGGSNDCSFS